ncbi:MULTISPECIES: DUF2239 family protein [unclassified Brevundimonas]|uniref:DUF2239 family protein n=1 Tax=unclassified Brevundimonas TaxID=2622653 RepID=UPI0025C72BFC|nr:MULTISPECIES: DUF2239 family protein [unclassified Brevundimonas]
MMTTASCTAFAGDRLIASGSPAVVASAAKAAHDSGERVLVFDNADARPVEFDLRGDLATVLARLPSEPVEKRGPGRPRLGVTAREVTLLPRHWNWLTSQPGGASVAMRKLVEAAMRDGEGPDRVRRSREAAYRFMTAMAGDQPAYEEATRMLFAGDWVAFDAAIEAWPSDVRDYARRLAEESWRNGRGRAG